MKFRIEDLNMNELVAVIRSIEKHLDYVEDSAQEEIEAGLKPADFWGEQKALLAETLAKVNRKKLVIDGDVL